MEAEVDTLCLLAQQEEDNNLKTKNNQNWQKIEPYGSPTTKELKKKHSSRPVGMAASGAGSQVERTGSEAVARGLGGPTSMCG